MVVTYARPSNPAFMQGFKMKYFGDFYKNLILASNPDRILIFTGDNRWFEQPQILKTLKGLNLL